MSGRDPQILNEDLRVSEGVLTKRHFNSKIYKYIENCYNELSAIVDYVDVNMPSISHEWCYENMVKFCTHLKYAQSLWYYGHVEKDSMHVFLGYIEYLTETIGNISIVIQDPHFEYIWKDAERFLGIVENYNYLKMVDIV